MPTWPLQKDCDAFYGNPRGSGGKSSAAWESANLVSVSCPWVLRYAGSPVKGLRVHKKTADSLRRVLNAIWERLGRSQAEIDRIGMSIYGGAFNYRDKRGGSSLSMHSYGCAVDFDPARNGFGDNTPAMDRRVIEEFEREGWEWGGHWSKKDGMHFQAARTRAVPPRLSPSPLVKEAQIARAAATLGGVPETDYSVWTENVKFGAVMAFQDAARPKGYYQTGKLDGYWGPLTVDAYEGFRRENGMQSDPGGVDLIETTKLVKASAPRVVLSRVAATAASLAPQSEVIQAQQGITWRARIGKRVLGVGGAVTGVTGTLIDKVLPQENLLRRFLADVDPIVWLGLLVVAAAAIYWLSKAQQEDAAKTIDIRVDEHKMGGAA